MSTDRYHAVMQSNEYSWSHRNSNIIFGDRSGQMHCRNSSPTFPCFNAIYMLQHIHKAFPCQSSISSTIKLELAHQAVMVLSKAPAAPQM